MQLHRVVKLFLERRSRTASGGSKCRTYSQLEKSVFFDDTDHLLLDQADVEMAPELLQLQSDEGIVFFVMFSALKC